MTSRLSQISMLAFAVLLISCTVLLGWIIKMDFLLSILPDAPTMKVNTALLFILSGLGILVSVRKNSRWQSFSYLLGGSILLFSFLTLLQYYNHEDLGIDNLLLPDPYDLPYPGRMARTTALCFMIFGIALITNKMKAELPQKITKCSLSLIALVAILEILTYFLQSVTEVKVLIFNAMAFHTAIGFFLLSLGLSLDDPTHSYLDLFSGTEIGSQLARKLLPFLVLLPLALSFFLLLIIGSRAMNTEYGVTIYTILYAVFGLTYISWVADKLNREDFRRKELENSLYKSNRELKEMIRFKKQLVRTSPETIMIINLNDRCVRYINRDIYPEAGMNKERIQGTTIENILPFIHPQDRQKIIDFHKKILKSDDNDIHDEEIRLKLKGTSWEWFSIRGKIFKRKNAQWVDEYVLLVRNIHKQKTTQKALLNAERFSIQGEVARTLAHELRNPLASISMATEVLGLRLGKSKKEELSNYFDILCRSTTRLNTLVGDLLDSSNYSPAKLKETDLANIIEASIEKASDRIYLSGIDLRKNYSGEYPVQADSEKLEIAILNILVNASEAIPPEKGIIDIHIETTSSHYILSIRDNGHGMEKEEIEHLFDAFYTNKKTGTGIGMTSVKNILEEHEADIKVCSKPGQGTTFRIYFQKF